jgi:hypothetical protein
LVNASTCVQNHVLRKRQRGKGMFPICYLSLHKYSHMSTGGSMIWVTSFFLRRLDGAKTSVEQEIVHNLKAPGQEEGDA